MVVEDISEVSRKLSKLETLLGKIGELAEASVYASEIREGAEILGFLRHVIKEDNLWSSVLERAPGFIIVTDTGGKIQYINQVRSGIKKEDTIGKSVYDFVPESFHQTIKNNFKYVLATGNTATFETIGEGDNKASVWYQSHIGPLYSEGKVTGHILVSTEIKKGE